MPVYTLLLVSAGRQQRIRSCITLVDPIPSLQRVKEKKALTALCGSEGLLEERKARIKGAWA